MFFKYTGMGNGDGQLGKYLGIVQVKNMPLDAFFVREVLGLSFTSEAGSSGFLMFVAKRSGNQASNKWLHTHFIIPTIVKFDECNKGLPGAEVIIYLLFIINIYIYMILIFIDAIRNLYRRRSAGFIFRNEP